MDRKKILLVEDERDLSYVLRCHFDKEGFALLTARTAEAGLAMARKHKPDLIIADIMLPKMDGLEMLRIIREESGIPFLFLSGKKDEIDRILGFKLGADDYVTKPFSMGELIARVKAILNRSAGRSVFRWEGQVRIGDIEVDYHRHEVRVGGRHRHLAPREFQVLESLIKADGKVLSREHLLKHVWGYDNSMDISTRTVDQHIARLRRKLLSEKQRVVTVKKFGYKFRTA